MAKKDNFSDSICALIERTEESTIKELEALDKEAWMDHWLLRVRAEKTFALMERASESLTVTAFQAARKTRQLSNLELARDAILQWLQSFELKLVDPVARAAPHPSPWLLPAMASPLGTPAARF